MALEIERKWVVPDPTAVPASTLGAVELRQGYLAEDGDVQVRLRVAGDRSLLTVKVGRGLAREEVELALDRAELEALWVATEGRRVRKTRHRVPLPRAGDAVAEVDQYHDELAGLWLVEVEFADDTAAGSFDPPGWFGVEVTGDARWSNSALARHGRPDVGPQGRTDSGTPAASAAAR